ncbi:MAG: hypothetical protein U0414_32820 [Polyangiaceae bacterium]
MAALVPHKKGVRRTARAERTATIPLSKAGGGGCRTLAARAGSALLGAAVLMGCAIRPTAEVRTAGAARHVPRAAPDGSHPAPADSPELRALAAQVAQEAANVAQFRYVSRVDEYLIVQADAPFVRVDDTGRSLRGEASPLFAEILAHLKNDPALRVRLEVYVSDEEPDVDPAAALAAPDPAPDPDGTDDPLAWGDPDAVSGQRAALLYQLLVDAGIARERLEYVGCGALRRANVSTLELAEPGPNACRGAIRTPHVEAR